MSRNIERGLLLIVTAILLASGTSVGQETKKYDYKDFTKVEASSGMHVKITGSDNYSVEVKISERDLKHFEVEKHGQTLEFKMKGWFQHRRDDIYITITMPKLSAISLSGGAMGQIDMDNSSAAFYGDVSGGAKLKGKLKCADVSLELSGGSWTSLTGSGRDLKVDGSGGATFNLKDFAVKNVSAELSGGSHAELNMNGKLNTDQSGGSHITYYGTAIMGRTDLSGGASVSKGE